MRIPRYSKAAKIKEPSFGLSCVRNSMKHVSNCGGACGPGPPGLRRQRRRPEHQRCVRLRGIRRAGHQHHPVLRRHCKDWAYQALANLIERYGCVAGYPNGTFRGNRAMTAEAAALLNACLDRITEVTDELRRLIKEFETELAVIRGRVDGLEARVGELEALSSPLPPS